MTDIGNANVNIIGNQVLKLGIENNLKCSPLTNDLKLVGIATTIASIW